MSKTENAQVDNYVYDTTSYRLTSVTGANSISLTHDAMGNTLTKDGISFTYNQQGRMATASKVGMNASYAYNFKGERSRKQVNGVTNHFVYDLNGQLIAEADSNGATVREYIYLNGQRFATIDNGVIYYVHTDHLGTPVALSDEAGVVQWKAYYTPFGKMIVEVDNLTQNIRFPGQYFDSESGLHYNYFRDYDPEIGRYIQSDPIGLNGGINTYGYVGGNPVMRIDPEGTWFFVPALIGGLTGFALSVGGDLVANNGNWDCINWGRAGFMGALGAVGGAGVAGAFGHSVKGLSWLTSSHRWNSVRQRYGRFHNLTFGKDVHHWLLSQSSRLASRFPGLVNHPWNLNPLVPNSINRGLFNTIGFIPRVVLGSPGWARATTGMGATGAIGEVLDDDCGCD